MSFHEPFEIHVKWKICFISHIRRRKKLSNLLMDKIVHECDCALEAWLTSTETVPFRTTKEYSAICLLHSVFHDEMRKVAYLINSGNFKEAKEYIALDTDYGRSSRQLGAHLSALSSLAKREKNKLLSVAGF